MTELETLRARVAELEEAFRKAEAGAGTVIRNLNANDFEGARYFAQDAAKHWDLALALLSDQPDAEPASKADFDTQMQKPLTALESAVAGLTLLEQAVRENDPHKELLIRVRDILGEIQEYREEQDAEPDVVERVWRAAVTGCLNIAIDEQNRSNDDDAPMPVLDAQGEIIRRIRGQLKMSDSDREFIGAAIAAMRPAQGEDVERLKRIAEVAELMVNDHQSNQSESYHAWLDVLISFFDDEETVPAMRPEIDAEKVAEIAARHETSQHRLSQSISDRDAWAVQAHADRAELLKMIGGNNAE